MLARAGRGHNSGRETCEWSVLHTVGVCKTCPAGTYGSSTGLTSAACSGPCNAGYYCMSGSSTGTAAQVGVAVGKAVGNALTPLPPHPPPPPRARRPPVRCRLLGRSGRKWTDVLRALLCRVRACAVFHNYWRVLLQCVRVMCGIGRYFCPGRSTTSTDVPCDSGYYGSTGQSGTRVCCCQCS